VPLNTRTERKTDRPIAEREESIVVRIMCSSTESGILTDPLGLYFYIYTALMLERIFRTSVRGLTRLRQLRYLLEPYISDDYE
jgi:hypothetical protein